MSASEEETELESFIVSQTVWAPVPLLSAPPIWAYQATDLSPIWAESQPFLDKHQLEPPYWAFIWPGGLALAMHLEEHPALVRGKRVVDFGSGSGLCGLAAARLGASEVIAVDRDALARAAIGLNARRQGLSVRVTATAPSLRAGDVLLAGDVYYEESPARAFAAWFRELAAAGVEVLTGDPGRAYVPSDFRCVAERMVPTSIAIEAEPHMRARILTPP